MVDTIEIILGIVSFTIIVNLMIFVILLARSRLVSTGNVSVEINGDPEKTISVPAGGKLLQTLADQNLFLSSACGGGGTCRSVVARFLTEVVQFYPLKKHMLIIEKRKIIGVCHAKFL